MKRGERVPKPWSAEQLLESMLDVGFLVFIGPGPYDGPPGTHRAYLFVVPHDELGPRLREWIHEHWDELMEIVRARGGVVGVCPDCGGRVFWRVHRAALACLDCAEGVPADVPEKWYLTEGVEG